MPGPVRVEIAPGTNLTAEPGGAPTIASIVVFNDRPIVDEIILTVAGLDPAWFTLSATSVRLMPGASSSAVLEIRLPSDTPAGRHAFHLLAASRSDPTVASDIEWTIDVARVGSVSIDVRPARATARRWADYAVHLANLSNAERTLRIETRDDQARLRYRYYPQHGTLPPNGELTCLLRAGPRRPRLVGGPLTFPFTVAAVEADDPLATPLGERPAELVQVAALPFLLAPFGGLRRAALLALPLLAALAVLAWIFGGPGLRGTPPPTIITPTPPPVAAPAAPPTVAAAAPAEPAAPESEAGATAAAPPLINHLALDLRFGQVAPVVPLAFDVVGATDTRVERTGVGSDAARQYRAIESSEYTLFARNDAGEVSQAITVYVLRPPVIASFQASVIQVGGTIILTWTTDRATRTYLNDAPLVGASGRLELPFDPNGKYVLRAENAAGMASRELELTPGPPAETPTPAPPAPPPSPTSTATLTPPPSPAATIAPTEEATAVVVVTPTATLVPTATDTPPPISTDTPTVTPTPTSSPTPTATPCPALTGLSLVARADGSGVGLRWMASGGCAPYSGALTADYPYARSSHDESVSSLTGDVHDTPPPPAACNTPATSNYTLVLRDRAGQTASASASSTRSTPCPSTPPAQISVVMPGTGSGTVVSSPAGISCSTAPSAVCSAVFDSGAQVVLTASPDANSFWDGWIGCTPLPSSPAPPATASVQCSLSATGGNTAVTATFNRRPVLTVNASGGGSLVGTVDGTPIQWTQSSGGTSTTCTATCTVVLPPGGAIQLIATPTSDTFFGGWTGCTPLPAAPSPPTIQASGCTLALPRVDTAVTAAFSPRPVLTINGPVGVGASSGGSVTGTADGTPIQWTVAGGGTSTTCNISSGSSAQPPATCSAVLPPNSAIVLTGTPNSVSILAGWTGCTSVTGPPTATPTASTTTTATVTATATPTQTPTATPMASAVATPSPTPVPVLAGQCTTTLTTVDHTITPNFRQPEISVSVLNGGAVRGTVNGAPVVWEGTSSADCLATCRAAVGLNQQVTLCALDNGPAPCPPTATPVATPTSGIGFIEWAGRAGPGDPQATLTFQVAGDRSETAVFGLILHIDVSGQGFGFVTDVPTSPRVPRLNCFPPGEGPEPVCSAPFVPDSTVTLSADPDDGSSVNAITGCSPTPPLPTLSTAFCTVVVTVPNQHLGVTFEGAPFLQVQVDGPGRVAGTLDGAPIRFPDDRDVCTDLCSGTFLPGTVVWTQTPDLTAVFAGWDSVCTPVAGSPSPPTASSSSCTHTTIVNETFFPTRARFGFLLTVNVTGDGSVTATQQGASLQWNGTTSTVCTATCTAAVSPGLQVTLTGTFGTTNTITWAGCTPSPTNVLVCTVTPTGHLTVTATFDSLITINVAGQVGGSLAVPQAGLTCRTDCTAPVSGTAEMTVVATADSGFFVSSLTGSGPSACQANPDATTEQCVMPMRTTRRATAAFEPGVPLDVTRTGTGSGSVVAQDTRLNCPPDCSTMVKRGRPIVLQAEPASGSTFVGWQGADVPAACQTTASATCRLAALRATRVGAEFAAQAGSPTATATTTSTPAPTASATSTPLPLTTAGAFAVVPTADPSSTPSSQPSPGLSPTPTAESTPSPIGTASPTLDATPGATPASTSAPTSVATLAPTSDPTPAPTSEPTSVTTPPPTSEPTTIATPEPPSEPTQAPTAIVTVAPTPDATPTLVLVLTPMTTLSPVTTLTPAFTPDPPASGSTSTPTPGP